MTSIRGHTLIELIAGVIRDELANEIDAYAGHSSPEQADPIDRVWVVAAILQDR